MLIKIVQIIGQRIQSEDAVYTITTRSKQDKTSLIMGNLITTSQLLVVLNMVQNCDFNHRRNNGLKTDFANILMVFMVGSVYNLAAVSSKTIMQAIFCTLLLKLTAILTRNKKLILTANKKD